MAMSIAMLPSIFLHPAWPHWLWLWPWFLHLASPDVCKYDPNVYRDKSSIALQNVNDQFWLPLSSRFPLYNRSVIVSENWFYVFSLGFGSRFHGLQFGFSLQKTVKSSD
jgi:hypothetical protein